MARPNNQPPDTTTTLPDILFDVQQCFELDSCQYLSTTDQTMETSEAHAWNRKINTMETSPQPKKLKDHCTPGDG